MRISCSLCVPIFLLSSLSGWAQVQPVLLYNLNFNSAPHQVNSIPAVGLGPATRTTFTPGPYNYGTPTIREGVGMLSDRPLEFDTVGNYANHDQIGLTVVPNGDAGFTKHYERYHITMDLLIQNLEWGPGYGGEFRVFLTAYQDHQILFTGDGRASTIVWDQYQAPSGGFTFGKPMSLAIDIDSLQNTLAVSIDGVQRHQGYYPADRFSDLILSGDTRSTFSVDVAVDNLKVWGLPEPASMAMLALATSCFVGKRRQPS